VPLFFVLVRRIFKSRHARTVGPGRSAPDEMPA
jgi:hypothetical protein